MITEKLAHLVVNTEYEKLPEKVVYQAKLCFTDFLAVSLRGSKTPSGKAVMNIINNKANDTDGSTILGCYKTSPSDASLVNGVFAHCLDLDDGHRFAQLHPGCSVIPASLSLCESLDKSVKEFICSMVVGYQVSIIMGMISNPYHRNMGFHSTGTCGTFGAAAAACSAIKLGFDDTVNALGLAGTQSAGLLESDHSGSMGKHLHAGKAAQAGVLSAILAKNGFTGASTIIDGEEGFLKTMVDPWQGCIALTPDKIPFVTPEKRDYGIKLEKILENNRYHILDVYFKKYPICRHLHSAVDATVEIFKQMVSDGVKTDEICNITVKTYKIAADHNEYHPQTFEAVRQSLPLSIAIGIIKGALNLQNIEINHDIISMASNVVIDHDQDMELLYPAKRPAEVIITTAKKTYSERVDLPKGEPENPFKKVDIQDKFQNLNPKIDINILKYINDLESFKVRDFMHLLHNATK